ncbi:DUF5689 domain-containing protein [Christiangramia fulva]|uniref:DUF5689 domain-containing protein n=1 Tax=Christiangramia fulva TaxID=2126553 RepID=UPI003C2B7741
MKFLIIGLMPILLGGCVSDEFETPELKNPSVEIDGNLTSIAAVKGNFDFSTGEIYNFEETNTWFTGYVISSDAAGNFYKKLVLQDKPENPTAGIQILLDDNSLFETYNFGRKVFIKLDGLSLGFNNGVLQLGIQNRGDIVAVPKSLIDDHVVRSESTLEIRPLPLKIADFSPEHSNLYVKIDHVQFEKSLVRDNDLFSFASNSVDQYDGARQMLSCETGETLILSTSTFSNFKMLLLPQGSGSVEGVLTRDFYDENYVIVLNSPEKLQLNGGRCDPQYLACGENTAMGSRLLFDENFDGVTSQTTLNSRHWTNVNVSGGETKFKPTLASGNRILRVSAYNTHESPVEVWLVTPPVNLDTSTEEVLSFDLRASYDNSMIIKAFITNNFTGNPKTTAWTLLDANIPLGPSNTSATIFKSSKIDISCMEGKVWIGFQYLGADPDKSTTYDLDNIRITGN